MSAIVRGSVDPGRHISFSGKCPAFEFEIEISDHVSRPYPTVPARPAIFFATNVLSHEVSRPPLSKILTANVLFCFIIDDRHVQSNNHLYGGVKSR